MKSHDLTLVIMEHVAIHILSKSLFKFLYVYNSCMFVYQGTAEKQHFYTEQRFL